MTEASEIARDNAVNQLRNVPGLEVFTPEDFHDLPPDQQQVFSQFYCVFVQMILKIKKVESIAICNIFCRDL